MFKYAELIEDVKSHSVSGKELYILFSKYAFLEQFSTVNMGPGIPREGSS